MHLLSRGPCAPCAGALKDFVTNVLGPTDDIVRFEYLQKNNRVSAR